jgi:hypothetical protein
MSCAGSLGLRSKPGNELFDRKKLNNRVGGAAYFLSTLKSAR